MSLTKMVSNSDQQFSEFYTAWLMLVYPSMNLFSSSVKAPALSPCQNASVAEYNTMPHFSPWEMQGVDPLQTYLWAYEGEVGNWTQLAWIYER